MKEINIKAPIITREDFGGSLDKFARACVDTEDIINEAIIDLFSEKELDTPAEGMIFEVMQKLSDKGKLTTAVIMGLIEKGFINCLVITLMTILKNGITTEREKLAVSHITTYALTKHLEEDEPSKEHK